MDSNIRICFMHPVYPYCCLVNIIINIKLQSSFRRQMNSQCVLIVRGLCLQCYCCSLVSVLSESSLKDSMQLLFIGIKCVVYGRWQLDWLHGFYFQENNFQFLFTLINWLALWIKMRCKIRKWDTEISEGTRVSTWGIFRTLFLLSFFHFSLDVFLFV